MSSSNDLLRALGELAKLYEEQADGVLTQAGAHSVLFGSKVCFRKRDGGLAQKSPSYTEMIPQLVRVFFCFFSVPDVPVSKKFLISKIHHENKIQADIQLSSIFNDLCIFIKYVSMVRPCTLQSGKLFNCQPTQKISRMGLIQCRHTPLPSSNPNGNHPDRSMQVNVNIRSKPMLLAQCFFCVCVCFGFLIPEI